MTEEEAQEYAQLKEQCMQQQQRIQEVEGLLLHALQRIEELERRLAKNSHNSSLPPSRDHGTRKPLGNREKSSRPSGGQTGHRGHALLQVEKPDEVMVHRPVVCQGCQHDLSREIGQVVERRQVQDLPPQRLWIQEHQAEAVCCPQCQHVTRASFPSDVCAPVQYGPRLRAVAVYLSQGQLLPVHRTAEILTDLFGAPVSEGAVLAWVGEAGRVLEDTCKRIRDWVERARLMHVDETSIHLMGKVRWIHVHATGNLTLYCWHGKRGAEGIEAMGVLPGYRGRAMHDRWTSYDRYTCTHSLCGAHLIRDALFVAEHDKQPWAQAMVEHLRHMAHITTCFREQGARHLPAEVRQRLLVEYFDILCQGYAAHAAQPMPPPPKKKGRKPQNPSLNLLDAFMKRAEQILGFLEDLSVPFTNNLAERDLRMIKVQQKISGTFRSPQGVSAFCTIRSYLSTMRKQGRPLLEALRAALTGTPFPIAWEPGT